MSIEIKEYVGNKPYETKKVSKAAKSNKTPNKKESFEEDLKKKKNKKHGDK